MTTSQLSAEFIQARDAFAAWYDAKTPEVQEFIDAIAEVTYGITEEHEYEQFMEVLADEGIDNAADFEDRFEVEFDYKSELYDYIENMVTDCFPFNVPSFVESHIDWESVWDCELRYDYVEIEFLNKTYLFRVA